MVAAARRRRPSLRQAAELSARSREERRPLHGHPSLRRAFALEHAPVPATTKPPRTPASEGDRRAAEAHDITAPWPSRRERDARRPPRPANARPRQIRHAMSRTAAGRSASASARGRAAPDTARGARSGVTSGSVVVPADSRLAHGAGHAWLTGGSWVTTTTVARRRGARSARRRGADRHDFRDATRGFRADVDALLHADAFGDALRAHEKAHVHLGALAVQSATLSSKAFRVPILRLGELCRAGARRDRQVTGADGD